MRSTVAAKSPQGAGCRGEVADGGLGVSEWRPRLREPVQQFEKGRGVAGRAISRIEHTTEFGAARADLMTHVDEKGIEIAQRGRSLLLQVSDRVVSGAKCLGRREQGVVGVAGQGIEQRVGVLEDAIQGRESPRRQFSQVLQAELGQLREKLAELPSGTVGISGNCVDAPVRCIGVSGWKSRSTRT